MTEKFYPALQAVEDVPPSSPPYATAADLPDSPLFESQHDALATKSSSPPPFFSSDDSREAADIANYESPRIFKNKHKRTWWDNSEWAKDRGVKKAKFSRNYDSGVYMMSDATDSAESPSVQHRSPFGLDGTSDAALQTEADTTLERDMDQEERCFLSYLSEKLDLNEQNYDFCGFRLQDRHIRQIGRLASVIKNVPDPGDELPAERQYRSMVPELFVSLRDNQLRHLTPSLFDVSNITCLVLTNNSIEELPAAIGRLRNLRELSVSNNKLRWFPYELLKLFGSQGHLDIIGDSGVPWLQNKTPQRFDERGLISIFIHLDEHLSHPDFLRHPMVAQHIGRLHDLVDAQPHREELVWHMRTIEAWPKYHNTSSFNLYDSYRERRWIDNSTALDLYDLYSEDPPEGDLWARGDARYLARTPVSYFDRTGAVLYGSPAPPTCNDDDFAVITETDRGTHGVPETIFAPSDFSNYTNPLSTIALHAALRHKDQEDLSIADLHAHIGEPAIPNVDALLAQAERNDCAGLGFRVFRQCHVCQREYVVARAEWIEWWMVKISVVFPFKVRVCSWACVPEEKRRRPEREFRWR